MRRYLLLLILLAAPAIYGQDKPIHIGEIEFFGYSGVNPDTVRAALPVHEGDEISRAVWQEKVGEVQLALREVIGHAPTDVASICCNRQGNLSIFIGIAARPLSYLPKPLGTAQLPSSIVKLYEQSLQVLDEATRKGVSIEDRSQGYSLSSYTPLRAVQLKMRAYALSHERLLREVLAHSANDRQRTVAAQLLGYARKSGTQVIALARASLDSNGDVRNNATRALAVLAEFNPDIAQHIPPQSFIEMLLSGKWTDLNKASALLSALTRSRDAKLLARLRGQEVLARLIEMARWRTGHADPARTILGRLAGIEETRLQQLVASGQTEEIINALHDAK
ncbi:MAG: hypothetical protein WCB68_20365 [Pyrinomonadaceae bacterium]